MARRILSLFVVFSLMFAFVSCGGSGSSEDSAKASFYDYLGDYSYDSSMAALVYEPVEDEEEYGIQYRSVKDINGLLNSGVPVMLYFYSSLSSDTYGITAGVEDIAQCTWNRMVVVMVDVLDNDELSSSYEISRVPEFVIVNGGSEQARFEGYNYEVWTMNDVALWVSSCGIRVDYSKLE